jgi:hypothetical protein
MVVKCKDCSSYCISWAKNKQECKCNNILGFHHDENELYPLVQDKDKVMLWDSANDAWISYNFDKVYESQFWSGFSGEPFAV